MKFRDLFSMSLSSLWKRKIRTILTILGVVIGTASIAVMISLGLGLKKASLEEIEQYGGLTTVTVSEKDAYEDMDAEGSGKKNKTVQHLNDGVVSQILQIPHVEYVYPVLESEVLILAGKYQCYTSVRGIPISGMEQLGLELADGRLPEEGEPLGFVFGNSVIGDFYNEKTGGGYWYDGQLPDVDLMQDNLMYVFDTEKYYDFIWGSQSESGTAVMPKKYMLPTYGVMAGKVEDYSGESNMIYCELDQLRRTLKKEFHGRAVPGQPLSVGGKPSKEIYYNYIMVGVDDMDEVSGVQTAISQMGYAADSNAEWVESMQGQFKYIQMALGGIGAVSMLVAAIGIANTMMMSIYERTKEIGIMKVLGCDMGNIQIMFLMEAGHIGLIGGVCGMGLSLGLSKAINVLVRAPEMGINVGGSDLSYVPLWLAVLSIGFAVLVSVLAGFFPSLRAMRLSPLAAIRNE